MPGQHLDVDGHRISLSNLQRVLYPATGTRKYDVIDYYLRIADAMLPHLADRPITRKRWPSGVGDAPFFEKALPAGVPEWVERVTIEHSDHRNDYPLARGAADLVWFGQLAALELHVPQWRIPQWRIPQSQIPQQQGAAHRPVAREDLRSDRLVLDLDPDPGVPLARCAEVALRIRDALDGAGLRSFPVTSGSKGIHVYARFPEPVSPAAASAVAKQLATSLAAAHPAGITATIAKAAREGRVFIDWSQNSAAKTTLCPYSLRGTEQPMVAAPRTWEELADPDLRQLSYREVLGRFESGGDPLAGLDPPPAGTDPRSADLEPPSAGEPPVPKRRSGPVLTLVKNPTPPPRAVPKQPVPKQHAPKRPAPKRPDVPAGPADPATRTAVTALRPMLASNEPVTGLGDDAWAFEAKWDGFRALVRHLDGRLRLLSRSGVDITADFPELGELGAALRGLDVVLDGEIVALNATGRTDFTLLSSRHRAAGATALNGDTAIKLYLFDVLYADGTLLDGAPWERRREILEALGSRIGTTRAVEIPPLLPGPAERAVELARERGWEGIVAKERSSRYLSGRRATAWRKQKNFSHIEAVVGGYRTGRGGSDRAISSLLLGLPEERGLRYVGRVGTGFTDTELADLLTELAPSQIRMCPFVGPLDRPVASSATWVLPKLVAEVQFMDWTSTGHLRHPSWRGIRRDKLPGDL